MRAVAFLLSLLLCSVAAANTAIMIDLGNGNYVGVLLTDNGVIPISKVNIVKINPTPPPVPTNVTKAILIYESEDATADWGTMVTQIRDQNLPIQILDQNTVDENDRPLPELQAAREAISSGLPVLVGFNGAGVVVATEANPTTAREVADTLEKWGLK